MGLTKPSVSFKLQKRNFNEKHYKNYDEYDDDVHVQFGQARFLVLFDFNKQILKTAC